MRINLSLCAAMLPLCALAAPAQTPSPAKHGMTLDDLAKVQRVGPPQISPDGAWIAYTLSHIDTGEDKNVSQLWMVSWDGAQTVQLTYGKDGAGSPQWSPDGRFLAFTSGREGEAKGSQVWVLDRRGGEAHQLTDVKMDLDGYRWSPDSKTLLLTLTQKGEPDPAKPGEKPKAPKPIVIDRYHFKQDIQGYLTDKEPHLYLFDIATKKLSKLTDGPASGAKAYAEESGVFSPDGTKVAFVSNQTQPDPDRFANPDIFVVDAKPGSHPRQLTTFTGHDGGPLEWTRDSKAILFREGVSPHYSIYDLAQMAMVPADGASPATVTLLAPKYDHWVGAPVLSPKGDAVLTEVQEDRQVFVVSIPLDGSGKVQRVTTGSGSASGLDAKAGHVAMLWTTDTAPAEIVALEDGRLRPLTHANDALMATLDLATVTDLSATSKDGNEAHGLFTLPLGYKPGTKVPMVLRIHGGPTAQDTHGFNADTQLFAAHGYAVLNVNYRGSTGRGEAYSYAINNDWGNKEVLDLLAMTDAAVATGSVDADQLGIGGWSYGGILTDYTIATTTRFKAASSGAGTGNLLGFYGIDEYILQYENEIGPPWKALDQYVRMSYPFLHADRIKTPTLFMGGDKDFNVPLQGGEQMYQALKSVGTTAELIVYPGQFHGFTRPSYIRDRYDHWFAWYDQYVRGIQPKPKPEPKPEEKKEDKK